MRFSRSSSAAIGARLDVVGRGQKPDAERRIADASARVDARANDKAQVVRPRRSIGAGDVEQGRKPRPAALTHDRETLDDKGAIEPDQRHDVGDGRERNEIERRHEVRTLCRRSRSPLRAKRG